MAHQNSVPKVCVALPVFNGEKDFEGALLSVMEQDFEDLDILICDNGSTDKTPEIYEKYAAQDPRIRISWADTSAKPCRGFNRGFLMNRSPYFMWAASDDRRDPSFIRKCVDILDADPAVALVYSHTHFIDDENNKIGYHKDPFDLTSESPSERYLEILGRLSYCNCFYGLYRAQFLAKTPVYEEVMVGMDALMITELLFHGKIVQIPEPLFFRNMHKSFVGADARKNNPNRYFDGWKWIYPTGSGIYCPCLDYALHHFDIVRVAPIPHEEKPKLFQATREKMTQGVSFNRIKPEIDRLIKLVLQNKFYEEWDAGSFLDQATPEWNALARPFYLTQLLLMLEKCLYLYPDYPGLQSARSICLAYLGRVKEAKMALELELEKFPQLQYAKELLRQYRSLDS